MTFFGGSGGDSLTGIQGSFTGAPGSKRKKESTDVNFHVSEMEMIVSAWVSRY